MEDFSGTKPMGLYEAAIGERNQNYYLSRFEDFDEKGSDLHASWNWAAFFFTGFWALYRKMYGWFVAWVFILTFFGMLGRAALTSNQASFWTLAGNFAVVISFAAYANSLYYLKVKARIAAAQKPNLDAERVSRRLSAEAGVHMWVPIGLGGLFVLGIVAAVALPAYEGYAKGQTMAANPVSNVETSPDWKNGVITPPAKPADKLPMADMSQFTPENQKRMAAEAISRGDYANALETLRILGTQGDAWAQFNLGVMYGNGQGVAQNDAESVKWYRLAAAQGIAPAQYNLGLMYAQGQGVTQDYAAAVKWYRLAAAQGYPIAQSNLGLMYEKGQGVVQDYSETLKWYRLAAAQGSPIAQSNLGKMYGNGLGVKQDYLEAVKWYRLAAAQGIAPAQYNLGLMYDNGGGVSRDYVEALKWYRLAAAQGSVPARFNIGLMYGKGDGVAKDIVRAHMWLNLAAVSANSSAVKARDNLAKEMSPQQIAQAQQMARDCQQRNFKGCD